MVCQLGHGEDGQSLSWGRSVVYRLAILCIMIILIGERFNLAGNAWRIASTSLHLGSSLKSSIHPPCGRHVDSFTVSEYARKSIQNASVYWDTCAHRSVIEVVTVKNSQTPKFRVRVTGPEIFLVDLIPTSDQQLLGDFRVSFIDKIHEYSIEILVLFEAWVDEDIQRNNMTWPGEGSISLQFKQGMPAGGSKSPISTDRWNIVSEDLMDFLRCTRYRTRDIELNATIEPKGGCSASLPKGMWAEYFATWNPPKDAQMLYISKETRKIDIQAWNIDEEQGRRVCFFGDSQMRHLYNAFIILTNGYAVFPSEPIGTINSKVVMKSRWHRYIEKNWAGFSDDVAVHAANCSDILINFGQWPAGWPEFFPWSFETFETRMREDVRFIQNITKASESRISWVSTNPRGYTQVLYMGKDWRHDVVIDTYNRISKEVAGELEISYIDLYKVIKPLQDLAYDGAHYAGILGDTLARELLYYLSWT